MIQQADSNFRTYSNKTEQDACAIIAFVSKKAECTHSNIVRTIDALQKMAHRSGDMDGEGDGCGVLIDLPRKIWARRLSEAGLREQLSEGRSFCVGHFLVLSHAKAEEKAIREQARSFLRAAGLEILCEQTGNTRDSELGKRAQKDAPLFWQVAGVAHGNDAAEINRMLFKCQMEMGQRLQGLHVLSLGLDTVNYVIRGFPSLLLRVYPELSDPFARSMATLGHSRYSTNTLPTVERAQPFGVLGHNGEINTIERLRSSAANLGIASVPGGSDSQDMNRLIEGLINIYGFELTEAMEMVFPPIYSEMNLYKEELQELYGFYRWFFPASAQGPAAVIARNGNITVGSVDALGLRPLWFGEDDYHYFLSSEKGVVEPTQLLSDPVPLSPGEKVALISYAGKGTEALGYDQYQRRLLTLMQRKKTLPKGALPCAPVKMNADMTNAVQSLPSRFSVNERTDDMAFLAGFGWHGYDFDIISKNALDGKDVIGSMGHQGALAALMPESAFANVADYFKEEVAVVTNPAIDREREAEHFSTHVLLGAKADIDDSGKQTRVVLEQPLLISETLLHQPVLCASGEQVCFDGNVASLEQVVNLFTQNGINPNKAYFLDATFKPDPDSVSNLKAMTEQLCSEACEAVAAGAELVVADDLASFKDGNVFIDPSLLVASLVKALEARGLRRRCGIIVASGALRNLHDVMFMLGMGADAVLPYTIWDVACKEAKEGLGKVQLVKNVMNVLRVGIEKVMSTMGIHELCGYGRIFAAIGLDAEFSALFGTRSFCSFDNIGLGYKRLEGVSLARLARVKDKNNAILYRDEPKNPKVGRTLRAVATGETGFYEMARVIEKIYKDAPVAIRHILGIKKGATAGKLPTTAVDISIGDHSMPILISAMSFGSQGENSFRAYAEAAKRANIICINGEGGELPDMLGKYRKNRGQQIASGRFGVSIGFLNSADFLEIKIGQGAKPGEGGHLPGTKVSSMVAQARHCKPGISLISPSNQHDIYSIEDLAQIVTELKTANPYAKVSVKIPVTGNVGTIAVGIAKAGADIVNLSGFEGGTGAAREHAKKFVGMPVEVGVSEAHRALVESGLRDKVEIWCDGGLRSGLDVVKMVLLGANRVGLGTVALMGVGCISCQKCHLDRCPKGISTQIRTKEDAEARNVKGFVPRQVDTASENLTRLLLAIGDEIRMHVAELGFARLQDIVGRTELLVQEAACDMINVATLLAPPVCDAACSASAPLRVVRRPLSHLTRLVSDLTMQAIDEGARHIMYMDECIKSTDRAVGTYLSGSLARYEGDKSEVDVKLKLQSSIPGNGLCAFNTKGLNLVIEGGAQDGVAKGSYGGSLVILKGVNACGRRVDGSAGKSFAYGAIEGRFVVQGYADSRACVRMSGADVIFGARITAPVMDTGAGRAMNAHLKGFAFEYMTGGRAVTLGDPGPWMCAGMTGGVVYQCLYPEFGFTTDSVAMRLARGADVVICKLDDNGLADLQELLGFYIEKLNESLQEAEAEAVKAILANAKERFVMITPRSASKSLK